MLADRGAKGPVAEGLRAGLHLPATQFRKLFAFVGAALPFWRDDDLRTPETAEDALSDQLCDYLNDAARSVPGFDAFKFQRETRDDRNIPLHRRVVPRTRMCATVTASVA